MGYGVVLRAWDLGSKPFWVDEAETGINALTVLERGVPADRYLGLPVYENTLTEPWPESPEYEFKDSSYSPGGVAVYHGWLPLYATAAGFALAGVRPDREAEAPRVQHTMEEMRRRTVAGRVPAVLFGAVFLVAVFFAGRRLYGPDAGWAALAAGSVCTPVVEFARQARYYSATLALTACCCLALVLMVRRGRWRDFLAGALAFVLLFHTHMLSFFSAGVACALAAPLLVRHPRGLGKLAAFAALVAAGVVPWVVLTGFVRWAGSLPKARSLLSAGDLLDFLRQLGPFPPLAALTLAWLLAAGACRRRLPGRLVRPFAEHRRAFLFLAAWALAGVLAFVAFMPAASYFYGRLVLTALVPGLLFGALLCAAAARAAAGRPAPALASGLFVLLLAAAGQVTWWQPAGPGTPTTYDVIERLRGLDLRPGARVYATPNHHLVLTFYTGMPVQSVAPVRKDFLDRYAGELVILEAGPRYEPLTWQDIQKALAEAGRPASEAEARRLEPLLATRLLREELQGRARRVTPPLGPAPDDVGVLLAYQRRETAARVERSLERAGSPMFKGYQLPDYGGWWQTYYYRFVGPEARTGPNLNYAARIREAEAEVLPLEWVLYRCPARIEENRGTK